MGAVFVDTSALYPLLVVADEAHDSARTTLERLRAQGAELVSTSYVVHECVTLLHRRWGLPAVRDWQARVEPALRIVWIDPAIHRAAMIALVSVGRSRISLTDWASFEVIRREAIPRAFAFDRHFRDRGFEVVPG